MVYGLILIAAFGALAIKVLDLIELQKVSKDRRPDFKDPFYWLPFIALPLIGAGLVFVYEQSGISLTPILALNVGASAPLILRSMASTFPPGGPIDPGEGA